MHGAQQLQLLHGDHIWPAVLLGLPPQTDVGGIYITGLACYVAPADFMLMHSCDNCAQLIDSKQRRKYEETQLVMAREKNFQNFRAHLHQVHTQHAHSTRTTAHAQSSALTLN